PGLGGHCIPIDPFYLTWAARKMGVNTRFIELAGEINTAMPQQVVERIAAALNEQGKPLNGSRLCVLGIAYTKDVDQPRARPASGSLEMLQKPVAQLSSNDPPIPPLPRKRHHNPRLNGDRLTQEFLTHQDCVLVDMDRSVYDFDRIARQPALILDRRN